MTIIRRASLFFALFGILVVSSASAQPAAEPAPAGLIILARTGDFAGLERPAVVFDHVRHVSVLGTDHCAECHLIEEGVIAPTFAATAGDLEGDALMNAYHDACRGCHLRRLGEGLEAGPQTCGECHRRDIRVFPDQAAMAYDYSLHARHVQAFNDEQDSCKRCHHMWDEQLQQLVYVKGQEDACSDCHMERKVGKVSSLKNASHVQCLSCHLQRRTEEEHAGPVVCVGCHDPAQRAAVKKLENVPRLLRGQPDQLWIHRRDGLSRLVAFNHVAHEPRTEFCTTCHHMTVQPCDVCHTVVQAPDGGGVTLETAYHGGDSELSCVGCHRVAQAKVACVGCHGGMAASDLGSACARCHAGPWLPPGAELPPAGPEEIEIVPLPPPSDDFPETVVIDVLSADYMGSTMPHQKIVARLDKGIRESSLASVLHGDLATGCAGCHHHSPPAERPPRCRACHGEVAQATTDRPGLKVAYHRQCIGCHQRMGIEKQGCTDCHEVKEVGA